MKKILLIIFAVLFSVQSHAVVWFDGHEPVSCTVVGGYSPVVVTALHMFSGDMLAVTGMPADIAYNKSKPQRKSHIAVYQLDKCDAKAIASLSQMGVLSTQLMDCKDAFFICVRDGRIVVVGNNGRGAAYGLLELSRLAGVSPWIWWGDVVPERKERLTLDDGFKTLQSPSVEYRGIFINDEDFSILNWADNMNPGGPSKKFPKAIGPQANKRIFQLLLRLRANTMWPAMHEVSRAFFAIKGNKEMADSCGIVIGSSHCEPLLRNNVGEWDKKKRGAYNFITNRKEVEHYWAERLQQMRGSEGLFTIGMRGIHDGSMEGVKTMDEKLHGLQSVIDCQRELIARCYDKNVEQVPQVFIPYKEVLEIYERGLRVPDDVTLMWCDDNYGYMTRLSDPAQQQRSGGGGVYYHLSYWGRPHDHLWLTTTQPGLIYNELRQAYDHNARKVWIVNVHDPKVAAYDLSLAMDMAWNINSVSPVTLRKHLHGWLAQQFGEQTATRISPSMERFYQLAAMRKPEFMGWTQTELDKKIYPRGLSQPQGTEFSETEFGGELERYLEQWEELEEAVQPRLQVEQGDAYFAHVLYPIQAASAMAHKHLLAQTGDTLAAVEAQEKIKALTLRYNEMQGGKWRGLMNSNPRNLPVFQDFTVTDSVTLRRTNSRPLNETSLDGCVVRNACSYDYAFGSVQAVEMLGHSMNAVALQKGSSIQFVFDAPRDGSAVIRTAMIPTQANDKGDIRYSVSIDGGEPVVYSLKEPYRSEQWKRNVLRQQALRQTSVQVAKGRHTLTVTALDDHIIMDQWMLDYKPSRQFYLFPVTEK
ncbi:MAG: glycosyl hydrolase 115 family protein [Prevotella sp.]|nr:glycosyl hydrolase 115 family protein [Prevotella sp.]MBR6191387.1 glycosyl hydrolase 115 family protein [Prevotella sp.]